MSEPMKVDTKRTELAREAHARGVETLNEIFRASLVLQLFPTRPRPKKGGGVPKNRRRVLARRRRQLQRALICSAFLYERDGERKPSGKKAKFGRRKKRRSRR